MSICLICLGWEQVVELTILILSLLNKRLLITMSNILKIGELPWVTLLIFIWLGIHLVALCQGTMQSNIISTLKSLYCYHLLESEFLGQNN